MLKFHRILFLSGVLISATTLSWGASDQSNIANELNPKINNVEVAVEHNGIDSKAKADAPKSGWWTNFLGGMRSCISCVREEEPIVAQTILQTIKDIKEIAEDADEVLADIKGEGKVPAAEPIKK